jgi:hypothetical protein
MSIIVEEKNKNKKSWHVYLKVLITLSHHYNVCIGWILSIDVKDL